MRGVIGISWNVGTRLPQHTTSHPRGWHLRRPTQFITLLHWVDCVWNVMVHAQKPDFVFRRNGRVHLNRRWASVQSTTGCRGVCISGSNAGYTMFRGSVKGTGYPLHSLVSPSLPLPCVTVCHHISTGLLTFFDSLRIASQLFGVSASGLSYGCYQSAGNVVSLKCISFVGGRSSSF